jgi:RNA polymerase sigma-70 factor (ECF subfamily)
MERYEAPIHRFLVTMLGDPEMAADCSQDTFVRAYQQLERGQPVTGAWLYKVARNRALDELRRRGRRRRHEGELHGAVASGPGFSVMTKEALARLSPDDRAILSLLAVDGFSVSEIAEMLGIKPSTTSMRIARARERLRRLLGEDDEST